ncbi:hypothetical protein [Solitalea lacus]|uniref:hypothetical protein n=1 Tax=Solitalea lacus TaxID=2911172 RepID=UPI001EDB248E|nr:hypothetical protein [Solitalea lacus]UKJ07924.1 hypothetical protein L2B55_01870 [Solitalea lacus]
MVEKKEIGFILQHIATKQFAMLEVTVQTTEEVKLETALNFGIDKENQTIGLFAKFAFEIKSKPFLLIEILCQFKIHPQAWESFKNKETSAIVVPKNFMTHLAMITVGTARGVLHAKTENTPYNNFILPTIDVTEIIKEDIVFKEEIKESK